MGDTLTTLGRESALLRGLVWSMRRDRAVQTPYDLAVAMGLLAERHARPTAQQEDCAAQAVVRYLCECVPDLTPLAVEAALFGEIGYGSSVVARSRRAAW